MIWGLSNGERIRAEPSKKAICDICNEELIAKCGSIKVWHWAHKVNADCDTWAEHETQWHLDWKNEFPKEQQEIVIGNHRADIKVNEKVIELQNSPISPQDIIAREIFYKDMLWLINGDTIGKNINIRLKKEDIITFRWKSPPKSWWFANKNIYIDFTDKLPIILLKLEELEQGKKIFKSVSYQVSNDYGDDCHWENSLEDITSEEKNKIRTELNLLINKPILLIKKMYKNIPCAGWGILLSKEEFLKQVKNGENRTTN